MGNNSCNGTGGRLVYLRQQLPGSKQKPLAQQPITQNLGSGVILGADGSNDLIVQVGHAVARAWNRLWSGVLGRSSAIAAVGATALLTSSPALADPDGYDPSPEYTEVATWHLQVAHVIAVLFNLGVSHLCRDYRSTDRKVPAQIVSALNYASAATNIAGIAAYSGLFSVSAIIAAMATVFAFPLFVLPKNPSDGKST